MAKVLKIDRENEKILVGMEDGTIRAFRENDFIFYPNVGDEVEVFESDYEVVIQKMVKDGSMPQITINNTNEQSQNQASVNENTNVNKNTINQSAVGKGKRVNKSLYLLLAISLGWFGVHKVYAGYSIFNIVKYSLLFFVAIGVVMNIMDILKALKQSPDEYGYIYV